MFKETQQQKVERYLREGRTVSGGDGNGPGKPGYKVITIDGDDSIADEQLNALADQGYEVVAMCPVEGTDSSRVILGNYKKD